ncbi:hypothetical protein NPIL_41691 [Nephila pilipes]|uniref:RNase H type-1 domain-containing protein n=1 Tax=Nephila pilipes TaxID=299642 RepID=A0A8X6UJA5_NEPPI|nr:hypothetical protein NPIL_41691 [Nephila pilipes]
MGPFWASLKVLAQMFLVTPFHSTFMLEHLSLTSLLTRNYPCSLQQLTVRLDTFERVVIFSYSVSTFQALSSNHESFHVQRCRFLLREFQGKVSFQLVASHCDLRGNEIADFLEKKGTASFQKSCRQLLLHSVKLEIERITKQPFHHAISLGADDKSGVCSVDPTVSRIHPMLLLWLCLDF